MYACADVHQRSHEMESGICQPVFSGVINPANRPRDSPLASAIQSTYLPAPAELRPDPVLGTEESRVVM